MKGQIVYLNGEYLPLDQAKVSVLDRGFIFGDGVYEVIPAYGGNLFRFSEHIQRLQNSLSAIRLSVSNTQDDWLDIIQKIIEQNEGIDQSIYLQITRGVAARDHGFPKKSSEPTIFVMSTPLSAQPEQIKDKGVRAVTLEDNRWSNCHIKAISLLANILLRQEALEQDAQEAILIKNGHATEGAASNLFIVKDQLIKTPVKSSELLPGVTRDLIVELAHQHNLSIEEGIILEKDLLDADEIWLTSSTKEILPVTQLDNNSVSDGKPGKVWSKMLALYQDYKVSLRNPTKEPSIEQIVPSSLKEEEEWIEFPCVFPLKVMGENDGSYPEFVLEVAKKYIDGIDESCIKTKESKTGKYISVTVTFMAHNRKQLDAVYFELNASERTRMTL